MEEGLPEWQNSSGRGKLIAPLAASPVSTSHRIARSFGWLQCQRRKLVLAGLSHPIRGHSQLSTFIYSYRAYGGGRGGGTRPAY